jgi:hypothetical protein
MTVCAEVSANNFPDTVIKLEYHKVISITVDITLLYINLVNVQNAYEMPYGLYKDLVTDDFAIAISTYVIKTYYIANTSIS